MSGAETHPERSELSAALHSVTVGIQEAVRLARESHEDPLDVVSSELWTVAAEAGAYVAYVVERTSALVARAGVEVLGVVDAAAAESVRRHPRPVALFAALAAAQADGDADGEGEGA